MKKLIIITALGLCGCEQDALQEYYKQISGFGYIPYVTPMAYSGTGTLVGGSPKSLALVTPPDTCFPKQIDGSETELRYRDETTLPQTHRRIEITGEMKADFMQLMAVGSPGITAGIAFHQVSNLDVTFKGASVEVMDTEAIISFYQDHMNQSCKNLLDRVGFIVQAMKVDQMEIQFYSDNGGHIELTAEKVKQLLDFNVDVEWRIIEESTLIIDSPKYVGYQLGRLQAQDDGMALYRSSKTQNNRFVFEYIGLFEDDDPSSVGSFPFAPPEPIDYSSLQSKKLKADYYQDASEIPDGKPHWDKAPQHKKKKRHREY